MRVCVHANQCFIFFFLLALFRVKKKKQFFFHMAAVCTIEEEIKGVNIIGSTPSSAGGLLPTVLQRAHISNYPLRF